MKWMNFIPLLVWSLGALFSSNWYEIELKKMDKYTPDHGTGYLIVYISGIITFLVIGIYLTCK